MSTDNVGLARFRGEFELVRVGPALLPEIASWRYGTRLARFEPEVDHQPGLFIRGARLIARATAGALVGYAHAVGFSDDAVLRMRTFRRGRGVLLRTSDEFGHPSSFATLTSVPRNWCVPRKTHRGSSSSTTTAASRRSRVTGAARRRARCSRRLNVGVATHAEVSHAIAKLDEAGDPEGYFTRVASLAMRTSWGRFPDAPPEQQEVHGSFSERLALQLANRSFWGRGGTGSDEQTPLFRLPAVDRLALEMAANEDIERRALLGELELLHAAWKDAEEIAAIADEMFTDDVLDEFKRQYFERLAQAEE
jgi:hypothetical protein